VIGSGTYSYVKKESSNTTEQTTGQSRRKKKLLEEIEEGTTFNIADILCVSS
jgi:hypothetical protein